MKQRNKAADTALRRRVIAAIRAWHRSTSRDRIRSIRHVHPRCFVVARVAPSCIVVAVPPCDQEPQIQGLQWNDYDTIRVFDVSLTHGSWCSTAYVSTATSGQPIAIPVVGLFEMDAPENRAKRHYFCQCGLACDRLTACDTGGS